MHTPTTTHAFRHHEMKSPDASHAQYLAWLEEYSLKSKESLAWWHTEVGGGGGAAVAV